MNSLNFSLYLQEHGSVTTGHGHRRPGGAGGAEEVRWEVERATYPDILGTSATRRDTVFTYSIGTDRGHSAGPVSKHTLGYKLWTIGKMRRRREKRTVYKNLKYQKKRERQLNKTQTKEHSRNNGRKIDKKGKRVNQKEILFCPSFFPRLCKHRFTR